jgi:hypothetical protein
MRPDTEFRRVDMYYRERLGLCRRAVKIAGIAGIADMSVSRCGRQAAWFWDRLPGRLESDIRGCSVQQTRYVSRRTRRMRRYGQVEASSYMTTERECVDLEEALIYSERVHRI